MTAAAIGWRNGNFEISGHSQLSADGGTLFDLVGELDSGYDLVDDCPPGHRADLAQLLVEGRIREFQACDVAALFNVDARGTVARWKRLRWLRALRRPGHPDVFTIAEITSFIEQYPERYDPRELLPPFDLVHRRTHGARQWLSTTQVARMLRVGVRTVEKWCVKGLIDYRQTGGGHRLIPSDAQMPQPRYRRKYSQR